jgi:hypothetical protein
MARTKRPFLRVLVALTCVAAVAFAIDHIVLGQRPRIVLYGDSLAMQSAQDFQYLAGTSGASTLLRAYGGLAVCDVLPELASDAESWQPTVAVLEFSGDDMTPCMKGYVAGSPAYFAKYEVDARAAVSALLGQGVRVVLIGAPVDVDARASSNADHLNAMYGSLAAHVRGVYYEDAGRFVLANGRVTWTLPCLRSEPCVGPQGTNIVRSPDGTHFCPDGRTAIEGSFDVCDVYSSGAYRFAAAMVASAVRT